MTESNRHHSATGETLGGELGWAWGSLHSQKGLRGSLWGTRHPCAVSAGRGQAWAPLPLQWVLHKPGPLQTLSEQRPDMEFPAVPLGDTGSLSDPLAFPSLEKRNSSRRGLESWQPLPCSCGIEAGGGRSAQVCCRLASTAPSPALLDTASEPSDRGFPGKGCLFSNAAGIRLTLYKALGNPVGDLWPPGAAAGGDVLVDSCLT